MSRLLIIGIDGMDSELIAKYVADLPNFQKIIRESPAINLTSVFPPDSDTAWASIYTGLNPAKHGVVEFVDPLQRKKINQPDYFYADAIRGKTFWDIAGKFGKKLCLIYPHLAYPVWPVNGFMISPHPQTGELQMYPPDFKFNFKMRKSKISKKIPRTKLEFKKYLDIKRQTINNEFEFASNMLINYDWHLFLFYSSALDSVKHIFWNYCDPNDPTYPGDNPFKNVIKDLYILYDQLIGEMLKVIDSETTLLVLSDHGHAMRPVRLFNINEVLRQAGFLSVKEGPLGPVHHTAERLKRAAVNIAQRSGLRPAAQTILRMFPKIKDIYTNPSTIDFNKTLAHCTDLSGMKSYTYGGISLLKENFSRGLKISDIKRWIINFLSNWEIPNTNEKIFKWICNREDLYSGCFIDKYPDILFELKEGYGAGWAVNVPIFTETSAHKFFPGSHRGRTPILYILNLDNINCVKNDVTLMDLAPTVLDILDIDYREYDFDGKSILG